MKRNGNGHAAGMQLNNEQKQVAALKRAIHIVCAKHKIGLRQMAYRPFAGGPIVSPRREHVFAVGDSVIMIGSHLEQTAQWKDAVKLETEIAQETARQLGMKFTDQALDLSCDMHNNTFRVRMTRIKQRLVTWRDIAKEAGDAIVLGRDQEAIGDLVTANLLDWAPGALVTGASRIAGKSNLIRLLVAQAACREWQIYLACMKGTHGWDDLAPLCRGGAAFNNEDGTVMLKHLIEEVKRRNANQKPKHPPLLLVWDEASRQWTSEENQNLLAQLASAAGSANFVMLVGIQVIGTTISRNIHENLTTVLVGKTATANASYSNSRVERLGAHKLAGKGHFYYVQSNGVVREVQVPRADSTSLRVDALAKQYNVAREEIIARVKNGDIDRSEVYSDIADLVKQARETLGIEKGTKPALVAPAANGSPFRTLTDVYVDMVKKERVENARRVPPSINLVGKTYAYIWRHGELPQMLQVGEWHKTMTGKGLNNRRIKTAIDTANDYYNYILHLIRVGRLKRFEVGGSFLTADPENPYPLEPSIPSIPFLPYLPAKIGETIIIEIRRPEGDSRCSVDS